MMRYLVYIDGAAKGNPGPAGIGVAIYREGEAAPIRCKKGFIGIATNNVAEYMALLLALEELLSIGAKRITILSDSQLLVRQMVGEYKVRSANLQPLYQKAIQLARVFDEVNFQHICREKNKKADALANEGIGEP